ncbi:MAG: ASCH domain-containing protein [bacterium]
MQEMKLQPRYFEYILHGTKRVELRLNDEKRKELKIGDKIKFLKEPEHIESFYVEITNLKRYDSFDNLFNSYTIDQLSDNTMTKEDLKEELEHFYTSEMQKKDGVLAIEFKFID